MATPENSSNTPSQCPRVIIARDIAERPDREALESRLAELCVDRGLRVVAMPHVYHLDDDAEVWQMLVKADGPIAAFTWIHPRPAEWILRRHNVGDGELQTHNLAAYDTAQQAFNALKDKWPGIDDTPSTAGRLQQISETTTERWYPVRDAARCINCGHCLQFCLFGVWELDDGGEVTVARPDNCKPGCPACARICPNAAIMFPLYERDGAIAGAPGEFVTLDPEARKMYYVRTETPCPVCGLVGEIGLDDADGEIVCPECGRRVADAQERFAASDQTRSANEDTESAPASDPTLAEIDRLIDDLDTLTDGS